MKIRFWGVIFMLAPQMALAASPVTFDPVPAKCADWSKEKHTPVDLYIAGMVSGMNTVSAADTAFHISDRYPQVGQKVGFDGIVSAVALKCSEHPEKTIQEAIIDVWFELGRKGE
ncbi:hypothetical protein [Komagataeibacter rhaeticus]|uniref:hypothetical protein n=1 Tax=Komagataeibacter rhaeticus TaxID=215221 RepID=UPI0039E95F65